MKSQFVSSSRLPIFLSGAVLLFILSVDGPAQSKSRRPGKDSLPRIGTIKDYPATGLMTGCGNLYFYPAAHARTSDDAYIFLARRDGDDAWMNLGGRDVRLRQIKSLSKANRKPHLYYYRLGKLRISVLIEAFKPDDASVSEGDSMFKMTITLRKGRATKVVRAIGDADC
jgi:hypothetical protein